MKILTRAGFRRQGYLLASLALAALGGQSLAGPAGGQGYAAAGCATGNCATCASSRPHHSEKGPCPPPHFHVFEGPPHLKFKKGCPRPVCDPCELPHFGYYQTCWSPWPYPPDWRHCPYPTASDMLPAPATPPYTPRLNAERYPELEAPRDARESGGADAVEEEVTPTPKRPPVPKPTEPPPQKFDNKGKVSALPMPVPNVRLVGSNEQR